MRINLWGMRGPAYDRPARTTLMKVTTVLLLAFSLPPRAQLALTLLLSIGLLTGGLLAVSVQTAGERPRARDLGIRPGSFDAGPLNAITDVPDLRVGQVTLIEGDRLRTGVTAIVPHGGNLFQDKVSGAVFVGNAFGKLAGSTQVDELGTIETPIVLTNTLAVGTAMEAVVRYTLAQPGNDQVRSVNALVGETNDGALNDIRALPVTGAHVRQAIDRATSGPVEEGAVGAGTGTICYGWKGGIGTASRRVPLGRGEGSGAAARAGAGAGAGAVSQVGYTLGVLVQTNFGGNLTIDGLPVWKTLGHAAFPRPADTVAHALEDGSAVTRGRGTSLRSLSPQAAEPASPDGSCMIVIATDAPLSPRDLQRLAARGVFGLARTGSSYSHGSGDFAIAFSTAPDARVKFGETAPRAKALLPSEAISPLFQAALEATEEAVYNSLLRAQTMTGNGRTIEAIPIDDVRTLLGNRR
jgi:D-aminopeptidase